MKYILFLMPYGKKTMLNNEEIFDFYEQFQKFKKNLEIENKNKVYIVDDLFSTDIYNKMYKAIYSADVVIADITTLNPNVMYELGIRHSLKKKKTVLIKKDNLNLEKIPFDISIYKVWSYSEFLEKYNDILNDDNNDSPILKELDFHLVLKKGNYKEIFNSFNKDINNFKKNLEKINSSCYNERFIFLEENNSFFGNEFFDLNYALNLYKKDEKNLENLIKSLKIIEKYNPLFSNNYEIKGLACSISRKIYEITENQKFKDKSLIYSFNFFSFSKNPYSFSSLVLHFAALIEKKQISFEFFKNINSFLLKEYGKIDWDFSSIYFKHTKILLEAAAMGKKTNFYENDFNNHEYITSNKQYKRIIDIYSDY